MSRYAISVKETLKRTVIVEAESLNEAIQRVEDAYEQDKIILDVDDYDETEIEPSPYFGDGSGEVPEREDVSYYWHLGEDN